MRIKPVTPLGLAFLFAVLLAGWASAANGLQSSPNAAGALASPTAKQLHGKSLSSSSSPHTTSQKGSASQKGSGDSTAQSGKQSTTHSTTQSGHQGGSVLRVHDNCPLPPTASLTGNWTHGPVRENAPPVTEV